MNSHDDAGRRRVVSRRELLAGGAGSVAAGGALLGPLTGTATASTDVPAGPSVNGTLARVDAGALTIADCHVSVDWAASGLPAVAGGEAVVTVDEHTTLYRDGTASIEDFRAGDRVVALIRRSSGGLVAASVEPVYVGIEGAIVGRDGNRLATRAGTVVVTAATSVSRDDASYRKLAADERAAALRAAGHVRATCRFEPATGEYVAVASELRAS